MGDGHPIGEKAQVLGALVARVQSLAEGVAGRSRSVGRLALAAAPVAWVTLFGRWPFDSIPQFLFFLVVLGVLVAPGLVLLGFARLLAGTVSKSESAMDELAGLVAGAGAEIGGGVAAAAAKPGLRSLASLLGTLWRLRDFRSEFGSVVMAVAGSGRLFNPLFLLWVGAAALGAGLVVLLAVVGVVTVVV